MKAWTELEKDIPLYWTGMREKPKSHWYLNHGVKIEKFVEDGRVEIKNTMTNCDMYDDVTEEEYEVFKNVGWEAGCMFVCVRVYKEKNNHFNSIIQRALDEGRTELANRLKEWQKKVINKLNEFESNLSIFLPYLQN